MAASEARTANGKWNNSGSLGESAFVRGDVSMLVRFDTSQARNGRRASDSRVTCVQRAKSSSTWRASAEVNARSRTIRFTSFASPTLVELKLKVPTDAQSSSTSEVLLCSIDGPYSNRRIPL